LDAPESKRLLTDGRPMPGVEIGLAPDGEILSRGPEAFVLSSDELRDVLTSVGLPSTCPAAPLVVAPLTLTGDRIGCLLAVGQSPDHEFDDLDLRLLAGIAHQAALLIRG